MMNDQGRGVRMLTGILQFRCGRRMRSSCDVHKGDGFGLERRSIRLRSKERNDIAA
jgi:hypothetical protein